jgi:integrase/recombinase XerD
MAVLASLQLKCLPWRHATAADAHEALARQQRVKERRGYRARSAFHYDSPHRLPKGRTFCSLLHYTGCKLTEALTLTPRQIDCANSAIVLIPRLRDVPRTIPVPKSLIELLDKTHRIRRAQHGLQADEPIWPYHANTMTKPVLRVIAEAGIAGGPHATPKGIRYGYLVQAIRERILLTRIHAWMGHVNLHYTAKLAEDLDLHAPELLGDEHAEAERMW